MTLHEDFDGREHYARLRDHVTGELAAIRSLMEKAVEQIHGAQLGATSQNEKIARIASQVENIERTVVRGNGTHSMLTRVALLEEQLRATGEHVEEAQEKFAQFDKQKTQYKGVVVVALVSLIGTVITAIAQLLRP